MEKDGLENYNHPALMYLSQVGLEHEIIEFLNEGINRDEECVFLTTRNNGKKILERLIFVNEKSKVIKHFTYYHIPDPKQNPKEFTKKMNYLKENILNEKAQGRVAFNVLDDISKFSITDISKIGDFERYLHKISNDKLKLFCSFKVDKSGDNNQKMIKMAFATHDHIMFERHS